MSNSESLPDRVSVVALKYGLAILTVAAALLITQSLKPTVFPTPLFFGAIVISTWFGGTGPGLLAVVLATSLLDYYFISPVYGLTLRTSDIPYLAQFVLPAMLSGWFTTKRKEAETALKQGKDQLEVKVQERTSELVRTNEIEGSVILVNGRNNESLDRFETRIDDGD